jgi:hypothetical protein
MTIWDRTRTTKAFDPGLLFNSSGEVDVARVFALLKQRSTRRVLMRE